MVEPSMDKHVTYGRVSLSQSAWDTKTHFNTCFDVRENGIIDVSVGCGFIPNTVIFALLFVDTLCHVLLRIIKGFHCNLKIFLVITRIFFVKFSNLKFQIRILTIKSNKFNYFPTIYWAIFSIGSNFVKKIKF